MKTSCAFAKLAAALLAGLFTSPLHAEQKPYEPILATSSRTGADDPDIKATFDRLRKAVDERDMKTIYDALGKSFTAVTCKFDPLQDCRPGQKGLRQPSSKLTPTQRLERGLCCTDTPRAKITKEITENAILGQFSAALVAETIGPHPDIAGLVCTPALTSFDRRKAARMVKAADILPIYLRVTEKDLPLREKPQKDARLIETLPAGSVVPLVAEMSSELPQNWNAISLPKGGLGYTDADGLNEMATPALCLKREGPNWKIALFIARED